MFEKPFSFEGRIRRTEYGLSMIFAFFLNIIARMILLAGEEAGSFIFFILFIPILWFTWAQGAKRCHDLGNSGWWQIIPFYGLWMLFQDGEKGQNSYGENPKGVNQTSSSSSSVKPNYSTNSGYSGGYSGGHNNPSGSTVNSAHNTQSKIDNSRNNNSEYKSGDLYK